MLESHRPRSDAFLQSGRRIFAPQETRISDIQPASPKETAIMDNQNDVAEDIDRLRKDAAQEAKKVGNEIGNHFDRAKDAARPFADRVSDGAKRAADGVSDAASKATDALGDAGRQIMDGDTRMVSGVGRYIRANPMASFALAVGAGLALSLLFKRR